MIFSNTLSKATVDHSTKEPMILGKPNWICRRCQNTFRAYPGAPKWPGGTSLCKEHNPNYVEKEPVV